MRLLNEYDRSGRNIQKLEQKIERQRETAINRVESRRQTEARNKILKLYAKMQRMIDNPGQADTQHVPRELSGPLARFLEMFASHEYDYREVQERRALSENAKQSINHSSL